MTESNNPLVHIGLRTDYVNDYGHLGEAKKLNDFKYLERIVVLSSLTPIGGEG